MTTYNGRDVVLVGFAFWVPFVKLAVRVPTWPRLRRDTAMTLPVGAIGSARPSAGRAAEGAIDHA